MKIWLISIWAVMIFQGSVFVYYLSSINRSIKEIKDVLKGKKE